MAGARFPTTRWSVVLVAGGDRLEARTALSSLCEAYWDPLYSFVRRRGFGPDDAQDLTQGFLLSLLEREDLRRVHPAAGRFRSFLCAAVKHFISNEMDRARALKRGGGAVTISFDAESAESRYRLEPRDDLDPERVFERRWAFTVLRRAEERLAEDLRAAGRDEERRILFPLVAGAGPRGSYAEAGRRLGISEDAAKMRVHRLRRRFGRLVREEIADTVADPALVEDELRHLQAAVRET
jgi:RNA polymerase sigma-70 factor (ECF subfamily)